jgi:hypothetical protein
VFAIEDQQLTLPDPIAPDTSFAFALIRQLVVYRSPSAL